MTGSMIRSCPAVPAPLDRHGCDCRRADRVLWRCQSGRRPRLDRLRLPGDLYRPAGLLLSTPHVLPAASLLSAPGAVLRCTGGECRSGGRGPVLLRWRLCVSDGPARGVRCILLLPRQRRHPCVGPRQLTQPEPIDGKPPGDEPEQIPGIEDYALIGDCHTAALVSAGGSIDWLCWPRFDSPAAFAALVGKPDNGRWRIAPDAENARASRRYRPGTMILETVFDTAQGSVALIDSWCRAPQFGGAHRRGPFGQRHPIARRSAAVRLRLDDSLGDAALAPARVPRHRRPGPGGAAQRRAAARAQYDTPRHVRRGGGAARVLCTARMGRPTGRSRTPPDAETALAEAEAFWTEWSGRCTYRWRVARAGAALADHAEGAELCADRRHRRRAHHLAAESNSAGNATGITGFAGCATRPSR